MKLARKPACPGLPVCMTEDRPAHDVRSTCGSNHGTDPADASLSINIDDEEKVQGDKGEVGSATHFFATPFDRIAYTQKPGPPHTTHTHQACHHVTKITVYEFVRVRHAEHKIGHKA